MPFDDKKNNNTVNYYSSVHDTMFYQRFKIADWSVDYKFRTYISQWKQSVGLAI